MFKHAPHPLETLLDAEWDRSYSKEKAVFPLKELRRSKFWPSVSRVDDGESLRSCAVKSKRDTGEYADRNSCR